ncbi:MAG: hypothetical protein ACJAS1_003092 [Oleiphilaceae bacterium]|jgi:hypothetical protein
MYQRDQGNYDVIGDIHGHVTKLENLLKKLDYAKSEQGVYSHASRKVIFLGDFIDGGSEHQQVIDIVKPMVENQAAYAIMGNHEFNAISFHTKHPGTALPLRERSIKNIGQHIEFLSEYQGHNDKMLIAIEWFKTLPLFLELLEVRAVHACWSDYEINKIKHYLMHDNTIKTELFDEFYVNANTKGTNEFDAVEVLLKGLEVPLPKGEKFKDKSGADRQEIRVKWWWQDGETYKDYALVPASVKVPSIPFPQEIIKNYLYSQNQKPVFIGHYWLQGKPEVQHRNIACLDYSVAKNGHQVAYRWTKGDDYLIDSNFVTSE